MWEGPVTDWWPAKTAALVERVVDGDTLVVILPVGPGLVRARVRLAGINTPEVRGGTADTRAWAEQCKDQLQRKVGGQTVWLEVVCQDHFGRLVAWVWWCVGIDRACTACPTDAVNICTWMLKTGPGCTPYIA